jgi:hypothetical protein
MFEAFIPDEKPSIENSTIMAQPPLRPVDRGDTYKIGSIPVSADTVILPKVKRYETEPSEGSLQENLYTEMLPKIQKILDGGRAFVMNDQNGKPTKVAGFFLSVGPDNKPLFTQLTEDRLTKGVRLIKPALEFRVDSQEGGLTNIFATVYSMERINGKLEYIPTEIRVSFNSNDAIERIQPDIYINGSKKPLNFNEDLGARQTMGDVSIWLDVFTSN